MAKNFGNEMWYIGMIFICINILCCMDTPCSLMCFTSNIDLSRHDYNGTHTSVYIDVNLCVSGN